MSENIKVFELAKDLGFKALDLLDKIKPLDLKLKNHMADLNPDQVEKIRSFLKPPASQTPAPKRASVRKKAAAASPATTRSAILVKSRSATVAAKAKAAAKLAEEAEQGAAEALAATMTVEAAAAVDDQTTASATVSPAQRPATGRRMGSSIIVKREQAPQVVAPPTLEEMMPEEVPPVAPEGSEVAAAPVAEPVDTVSETTEAPVAPAGRRGPRYSIIRVVSGQAEAPRRSITVEEAPSMKARTSAPKTFTDPTLARTGSALIEDEEARKKRSTLSPRTKSDEEMLFKSTDYLRRERVYQPKKKKISIGLSRSKSKVSTVQASAHKRVVEFDTRMSVEDLAGQLAVKSRDVMKKLESLGVDMPDEVEGFHDWYLDFETVQLTAAEFEFDAKEITFKEEALLEAETKVDEKDFKSRSPVVTIMGHVDHGKTSLLDTIRRARVASGEAGGITQHIGAYTVKVSDAIKNLQNMSGDKKDKKEKKKEEKASAKATKKTKEKSGKGGKDLLTFLDTPGHAAFSSMRARGAKVTDIVILVVSAVDGVMPQTKEAVEHAKAAGVPLIVAVNKCDLPEANPDRIKQQLGDFGILPEEWGGETIFVNLSAKTGDGVDKLLEMLQLQAEVLDLKARAEGVAEGTIIEAKLDKGRGPLATVLIKSGVLKVGDYIVAGTQSGKVRALIDDNGAQVREAGPSTPVEILGLSGVPEAGEPLNAVTDERASKTLAGHRLELKKAEAEKAKGFTAEDLFARMASGDLKELAIILKADVKGSAEAISAALHKLPQDKVRIKILSSGVGGVSESDVLLASASKALVVGFNVRPDNKAQAEAERRGVTIKSYSIIYELLDEITKAMEGLLAPTLKENITGSLEVRNVFMITKVGQVAGCYVTKGKVARSNQVRLIRDGRVIYTGKISGLKRFKDDAKEVAEGFECGLSIEGYNDIKVGDQIESFSVESLASKLIDGPTANA